MGCGNQVELDRDRVGACRVTAGRPCEGLGSASKQLGRSHETTNASAVGCRDSADGDAVGGSSCRESTTTLSTTTTTTPDTEPPVITVPGLEVCAIEDPLNMQPCLVVEATETNGVVVDYQATATDETAVDSFSCDPPTGSTFGVITPDELPDNPPNRLPRSDTRVVCTATDLAGNQSEEVFWVLVVLVTPQTSTTADVADETLPLTGSAVDGGVGLGLAAVAIGVLLLASTIRRERT